MAQTKRKRRSKHRGNAAGTVEARGRTSRQVKLSPAEQKKLDRQKSRDARTSRVPTWRSAAVKAAMMSVLLFLFTQLGLLGNKATLATSLFFAVAAMVIYTPLAYVTDQFVYRRVQKRQTKAREADSGR
jgi:hypothetical protein